MAKKALGKGLSSIFEDLGTPIVNEGNDTFVHKVNLEKIAPNPFQPRTIFDESEIKELSSSIKNNGLLQPIILRKHHGKYQIIAGERRFRATKLLDQKTITAYVREKITDRDMMELSIIENIHRVQLPPLEEADSYMRLIENCGYTHEKLSTKLSKNRSTITNTLRLLKLTPAVQKLLSSGKLTAGHARTLLQLPEKDQLPTAEKIISEGLNVRGAESLKKAPSKTKASPKKVDPNLAAVLSQMKYSLGAKVGLNGSDSKGKIEIFYNSQDELQHLIDSITKISPS